MPLAKASSIYISIYHLNTPCLLAGCGTFLFKLILSLQIFKDKSSSWRTSKRCVICWWCLLYCRGLSYYVWFISLHVRWRNAKGTPVQASSSFHQMGAPSYPWQEICPYPLWSHCNLWYCWWKFCHCLLFRRSVSLLRLQLDFFSFVFAWNENDRDVFPQGLI